MKRKLVRALCMWLVMSMVLLSVGYAGGISDPAGSDTPLEPLTLTIFGGGTDPGTFDEDPVHQFIREKLGVDIVQIYTANDTDTQLTLWLAAGDYPDAIAQKLGTGTQNYVTGGHALDLTEWYEKYAPDLYAKYLENPRIFHFDYPGYNDRIYYVPGQLGSSEYPNIEPTVGVRYDIWKMTADSEGNLVKPKDLDEFYDLAKAMVEAQPEYDGKKCYAFSGWFGSGWGGQWLVWSLTRFAGSYQWTGASVEAEDWQREYCFDSDAWMWAMRFLNRAYRDGIADPEAVTMSQEDYNKKLAQGLIYTTPYSGFWLDGVANTARAAAGQPEQKIFPYSWMTYPESSGISGQSVTGAYDPTGIIKTMFTKNCEDAEEIFKRLAWLSTEEGVALQGMGLEGVHWDYDEDGFRKPKDEIIQQFLEDPNFIHKTGIDKWNVFGNYFSGCDSKGDAYRITENKYVIATQEGPLDIEYKQFLDMNMNLSIEANAARAGTVTDEVEWIVDLGVNGTDLEDIINQLGSLESEYIGKLYLAKDDAEFDRLIDEWRSRCEMIDYMDYYNHINPIIKEAYQSYKAGK